MSVVKVGRKGWWIVERDLRHCSHERNDGVNAIRRIRPTGQTVFSRLAWMVVFAGLIGCDTERLKVVPVEGTLLIGGKPAARANIALHSLDPQIISCPVGYTEADGSFRLMTYEVNDGAPVGDYVLTIFWRDESMPFDGCAGDELIKHDLLHGAYFNRFTSPLRAIIRSDSNKIVIRADDVRERMGKKSDVE